MAQWLCITQACHTADCSMEVASSDREARSSVLISANPHISCICVYMCAYVHINSHQTRNPTLHAYFIYEKLYLSLPLPSFLQVVTLECICVDGIVFLSLFKLRIFWLAHPRHTRDWCNAPISRSESTLQCDTGTY